MAGKISRKQGAITVVITMFITQIVLKSIGANKIGAVIVATFVMAIGIVSAVAIIKYKNKGLGHRVNIPFSIITLLTFILLGSMVIMFTSYPQFVDTHKILAMTIAFSAIGSFFVFIIFIIVASCIYINSKR